MSFGDRAVASCLVAFSNGTVVERAVRDILKCDDVDVSSIEIFLANNNDDVRRAAGRIVAAKGNVSVAVDAVLDEHNFSSILGLLDVIAERGFDDTDAGKLSDFFSRHGVLESQIKEHVIGIFRRSGKKSALFPLLFDDDDKMVERIKGYLE